MSDIPPNKGAGPEGSTRPKMTKSDFKLAREALKKEVGLKIPRVGETPPDVFAEDVLPEDILPEDIFPSAAKAPRRKKPGRDSASNWQPVNDAAAPRTSGANKGGVNAGGYNPGSEKAPWGRWLISLLFLAMIAAGAIWLISKVVVPKDVPGGPVISLPSEQPAENTEEAPPPKSADEQAWVEALEKDTLQGYRDYLAAFPKGRYKEKAQEEINAYDEKDWARAESRSTIAGYKDYVNAWPNGLHTAKAKERIAQMQAAIDARQKDAAERAAREQNDWQQAATLNTVPAYETYVGQHPTGPNVDEARRRISQLQASSADEAAWQTAKTANIAAAYERYLSSYPQGRYAPDAMKAIEALRPAAGRTFRDCDVCPQMVSLASGSADLGAGDGEPGVRPNEMPKRPVIISNMFAIGVTEVTFDQWQACASAGACPSIGNDNGWGRGRRPVIRVSWDAAQKYTAWLSQKTGHSYALPSEAQWEYAARAGDNGVWIGGSQKALCAFGNGASSESGVAWANSQCSDMASDRTLPAGMLSANKFGVKDIIGNVAEWTLDCNTVNLNDAPTNGDPDLRGSCNQRVTRGGSWFSGPDDLRFGARMMQRRGDSNDFTGFRVVRKVDG